MGLGVNVAFMFGHLIAFAIGVWCIVETEHQNTIQASLALKLLMAYDMIFLVVLLGVVIWSICKRRRNPLMVPGEERTTADLPSLDLEG